MIKFCQTVALISTNYCLKHGSSTKSKTATIKGKLFYDNMLFWSVKCTKSSKKIGHLPQKKPNAVKFPKMYNFCFGQNNQAGITIVKKIKSDAK